MSTDPRLRPMPPPPPPPPPNTEPESTVMSLDGTDERDPRPPQSTLAPQPSQPPEPQPNGPTAREGQHQNQQSSDSNTSSGFKLKFCTVCASNNNRSMEAHLRLTTAPSGAYPTISFGTGSLVRLPGPTISQPNVYNFNTTSYASMYQELLDKDQKLYRANGILPMLERNKGVKWGPERWQDWRIGVPRVGRRGWSSQTSDPDAADADAEAEYKDDKGYYGTEAGTVDVVITCEERCWEAVIDDLLTRASPLNRPVHVFNVDIKDNHEEALIGGRAILELADELNAAAGREREAWVQNGGAVNGFDAAQSGARMGFDEQVPEILAQWQERWPTLPALWTLAWF